MPYGAHETLELHECLMEKINAITHFNLYANATQNPQLLDMIVRHQQEEIASYNAAVASTRGNTRFAPIPPNTNIRGVNNQQIQYGLNNRMAAFAPQANTTIGDVEIAIAMLLKHKSGARTCLNAALESADPNLRQLLLNSTATCVNQAYEVFLFLNQHGVYQVPTLETRTAEAFLSSYQPADRSLQAQYRVQAGQGAGFSQTAGAGNYQYATSGAPGSNVMAEAGLSIGSPESVLYGSGGSTFSNSFNLGTTQ